MKSESPDNLRSDGSDEGGTRRISWQLAAAVVLSVVFVAAAIRFLPSGAIKLMLMAALALPAIFFLVSKPEYVLALMLFTRISNLDIFLPMRLIRPLSVLLVAALLAVRLDGRKLAFRDRTLVILLIAFMLTAFHSSAFSEDISVSLKLLESLTGVFIVLGATLLLVNTRKYFLQFIIVVFIATMVSDFFPFILPPPENYMSSSLMWGEGVLRYEGYQFEANMFAFHQIIIIPILFYFLARFDRPWIVRPFIIAVLGGTIFVLMLSFSRGGFVGLIMILIMLLIVERKNRAFMTVAIVGGAILLVAAPAAYWDRIVSIIDAAQHVSEDYSVMVRVQTMKIAALFGLKNPLFGVGIGNFILEASRYLPFTKVVHNVYLQVFSEMGLPGLLIIASIFVRNIFIIRSMISSDSDVDKVRLGRFLMVQQIAVTVTAMFIPIAYEFLFWLPMVIPSLAALAYSEKRAEPERP